jgi:zinc protease
VTRKTGHAILRHRLENGLRVVLAPDSRVPVVAVNLSYAVGSSHEHQGRTGFAHLFEHMMFQGSASVATGEHIQLIQSVGGRSNAYTGIDATVYTETLPSHQLELALWLEADRMGSLGAALSQETLENQRDVVKNERRASVDNVPYGTWDEKLHALSFPETHPYHHATLGSMEDLSAATLEDVRQFFAIHYLPNNAVLTVVGDLDVEPTYEMIARHFGPISRGADPPPMPGDVTAVAPGGAREEVTDDVPLARVFLGYRTAPFGDERFDVIGLVADLLASGRASRLQARLVRELRIAQAVEADAFPLVAGASFLLLDVVASPDVAAAEVEAALIAELQRLLDEPPTEDEIARIRLRRATIRASERQKADERADRIGEYACLLDEPERFGTEDKRDLAISPETVHMEATRTFTDENRVSLWYVPSG